MGVKTGFLPGAVSILVESSTAFLGSTGDDRGDLARWLGLHQIISELDNLGDPVMIIVECNAGGSKDFRMASSGIVGELDGEVLVPSLVGVFSIRSMFDVGEQLVKDIHVLSQIVFKIHLMIVESVGLSLDVGGLFPEEVGIHSFVDVDRVPCNDVGFADIV